MALSAWIELPDFVDARSPDNGVIYHACAPRQSYFGPWQYNGSLYTICTGGYNFAPHAVSSSDGGYIWSEVDVVSNEYHGDREWRVCRYANKLRVARYDFHASSAIRLRDFDMASGTWGTDDFASTGAPYARSSYNGIVTTDAGQSFVFYSPYGWDGDTLLNANDLWLGIWNGSSSWSTAQIDAAGYDYWYVFSAAALNDSGGAELLYADMMPDTPVYYHRSIAADGTIGSRTTITGITDDPIDIENRIAVWNGCVWIPFWDSGTSSYKVHRRTSSPEAWDVVDLATPSSAPTYPDCIAFVSEDGSRLKVGFWDPDPRGGQRFLIAGTADGSTWSIEAGFTTYPSTDQYLPISASDYGGFVAHNGLNRIMEYFVFSTPPTPPPTPTGSGGNYAF